MSISPAIFEHLPILPIQSRNRFYSHPDDYVLIEIVSPSRGIVYSLIDLDNVELAAVYRWNISNGYVKAYIQRADGVKTTIKLARLVCPCAPGIEVDHVFGNKLDNRKMNLRVATHSDNMFNKILPKNNTSGVKGCVWIEKLNKWRGQIKLDRTTTIFGYYDTREETGLAYDEQAVERFGCYARLNFGEHGVSRIKLATVIVQPSAFLLAHHPGGLTAALQKKPPTKADVRGGAFIVSMKAG